MEKYEDAEEFLRWSNFRSAVNKTSDYGSNFGCRWEVIPRSIISSIKMRPKNRGISIEKLQRIAERGYKEREECDIDQFEAFKEKYL